MVKEPDTDLITMKEAPSISRELKDRLTNLRAVIHGGSSGNAIFKNKVQFVEDTFTDERWMNLRDIAKDLIAK